MVQSNFHKRREHWWHYYEVFDLFLSQKSLDDRPNYLRMGDHETYEVEKDVFHELDTHLQVVKLNLKVVYDFEDLICVTA